MSRLLRELIDIPERVGRNDFVVDLSRGVTNPKETVETYVVTDDLAARFDEALALIQGALAERSSRAAYLHGSFGSGKSHFMAVLLLLLEGNPDARAKAALGGVVSKHDAWLEGKRFLLVPYHMIGAKDLESAILGGYVEHVARVHPGSPPPAVYVADSLLEDARSLRVNLGDEAFFARLGGDEDPEWGALGDDAWSPERFEAAMSAPQGSDERDALVGAVVQAFFSASYGALADAAGARAYIELDKGLEVLSRHAKSLGYDGLLLFLDELILWLASKIQDQAFVADAAEKLVKLREAQHAERPVPIVSFIARQRDLRELVGEHVPGVEKLAFDDSLQHSSGRFQRITLSDANLPVIARERLLQPRDDAAKAEIDAEFERLTQGPGEVLDVLTTSTGDRRQFRDTYPFSPAFMTALVALSSALQRQRTALKVLVALLVDQRDRLSLGDLVPVGDLFDALASDDQPFSQEMLDRFLAARKLYDSRLRPLLLAEHGLEADAVATLEPRHPFFADDRVIKTLLLAALDTGVEPLRGLTVSRLAALNHGSIRTPIPRGERTLVGSKVNGWASVVSQIKVSGDPQDPSVAVQLTGVDTDALLARVQGIDSQGERRQTVRRLVVEALGIDQRALLERFEFDTVWRGTRRTADLVFGNLRDEQELPDAALRAEGERWKVIVDFPFDVAGRGPTDDRARAEKYTQTAEATRTACWIPTHLTEKLREDLGRFVKIDHLLTGERFEQHAGELSQLDRHDARAQLESQRAVLRERLTSALLQAYGVAPSEPAVVDTSFAPSERFQSLDPSFTLTPPVASTLREALEALLDQALAHQYPAHPHFDVEVKRGELRKVLDQVRRAAGTPDGRIVVEQPLRSALRGIANPLRVGEMHEQGFVLGDHWRRHFLKREADDGGGALTVGRLRGLIDEPKAMGLPRPVQNLVICAFAEMEDRAFVGTDGAVVPGDLERLDDELELQEQQPPDPGRWREASERAGAVLGVAASPSSSASAAAALTTEVRARANERRADAESLVAELGARLDQLGLDPAESDRLRSARAGAELLRAIADEPSERTVEVLAEADLATGAEALGRSVASAGALLDRLRATSWPVLKAAGELGDHRADRARALRVEAADVLARDELSLPLRPAMARLEEQAAALLAEPPPPPPPVERTGEREGLEHSRARELLEGILAAVEEDPESRLDVSWHIGGGAQE